MLACREAREAKTKELPRTGRLMRPMPIPPLPHNWTEKVLSSGGRIFRHTRQPRTAITVNADWDVAPLTLAETEAYYMGAIEAHELALDAAALLGWIRGRSVAAKRGES
jgi:hypothetical protein